jgi:hypothetical protein
VPRRQLLRPWGVPSYSHHGSRRRDPVRSPPSASKRAGRLLTRRPAPAHIYARVGEPPLPQGSERAATDRPSACNCTTYAVAASEMRMCASSERELGRVRRGGIAAGTCRLDRGGIGRLNRGTASETKVNRAPPEGAARPRGLLEKALRSRPPNYPNRVRHIERRRRAVRSRIAVARSVETRPVG